MYMIWYYVQKQASNEFCTTNSLKVKTEKSKVII